MKKFKELEISNGSIDDYRNIIRNIKVNHPANWHYNSDAINDYRKMTNIPEENIICLISPIIEEREALVWFGIGVSDSILKIFNIVPTNVGSLDYSEYNAILDSFYDECVKQYIQSTNLNVKISSDKLNIEELVGKETYKALVLWESSCNKTTGNTHPMDFKRWANFVIKAHKKSPNFTSDILERWLEESQMWGDDEIITRLVLDYEYSLNLLNEYDDYK